MPQHNGDSMATPHVEQLYDNQINNYFDKLKVQFWRNSPYSIIKW
jgi:hypothetical protein